MYGQMCLGLLPQCKKQTIKLHLRYGYVVKSKKAPIVPIQKCLTNDIIIQYTNKECNCLSNN